MLTALLHRLFPPVPSIDGDTFILWEPCSKSHGEIIPGYASYLLALGYKVVVLMTPARIPEGLFCRFSHPRLTLARLSQRRIRRFMRSAEVGKSAGVMVSTVGKLKDTPDGQVDLQAVFGPQRPRRLILVDHDVEARVKAGFWDPSTVTLRAIDGLASRVVNPHDFGPVAEHPKTKDRTVLVMVGAVRDKRRNQNLVYEALERLVAAGKTGFELRLIGKPGKDEIPETLRPHVVKVGYVDFRQLYAEVEAADFLVTSFQRDNENHAPYRTTKTTGSFQLSYGFSTPCIVQRAFAAGTAFTEGNALFYDDDVQIRDALEKAIDMPADAYADMTAALRADARRLYDASLANMRILTSA